ncbi:SDR family NAD(P)-dependent oxidoreductase [Mycolicibacterium hodleri]|uniref:SDR family NAD(P)-dependent oxidoreductase n=1 Tax=Mycolicibacterium hodleri TaxID=49897 RepID=A0A502EDS7_9MYCO|nr:SDR family NAD(P)-dependent oxidoreductase [Mycolicibacterium hodleri]TPG35122.1 SDR family NAD(P)-dependent oxidoreductase [Mycolicibacterium hodleri]
MTFAERYGPWAVVTGASDGIGLATAKLLAASGINLVLVARRYELLRQIAAELIAVHGIQTRVISADLARAEAADDVSAATQELDVGLAVLAAGFGDSRAFPDATLAGELDMIGVNVGAVTRLTHLFGGRLIERRRGGIVLFGSIVGWQGVPGQATYAATKAYVQSFAEGIHPEYAAHGVDVLCVAPGPVNSGFGARAGLNMDGATAPDLVARGALRALGRRATVIPGARGKVLTTSLRPLPRRIRSRVLGRVIAGMRDPGPVT